MMQALVFSAIFFSAYWLNGLGDITGAVPNQSSCSLSVNNGVCSNNTYCKCATTTSGVNICTMQMSCTDSDACNATTGCQKNGTICVEDSRCPNRPTCYSTLLFDHDSCPPLQTTTQSEA